MSSVNYEKLRTMNKRIAERSEGGGSVVYASKIEGELDIRVLPPRKNMGGIPYVEVVKYFIDGKYYFSPASFGEDDPIAEEVKEARASEDEELVEMLDDNDKYRKSYEYMFPILELKAKYNKKEELIGCEVVGEKGKIFSGGTKLATQMNDYITNRKYMNDGDGFVDRELGRNLTVTKTGTKLKTAYAAQPWPDAMEMDEKYYGKAVPDVVAYVKEQIKDADYLRQVIRHFLYGEDITLNPDGTEKEEDDDAPVSKKGAAKKPLAKSSKKPAAEEEDEEEEEEDEEPAPKKSVKKVARKPAPEEEEEEEEEDPETEDEEEEEPAPRKSAKKKPAAEEEEEEDEPEEEEEEEDEPAPRKSVKKPVKAASKKAAAEEEEEEDEEPAPKKAGGVALVTRDKAGNKVYPPGHPKYVAPAKSKKAAAEEEEEEDEEPAPKKSAAKKPVTPAKKSVGKKKDLTRMIEEEDDDN